MINEQSARTRSRPHRRPYIDTIPPAISNGAVRDMYRHQQNAWGFVPNYAKIFSHRPGLMDRWAQLLAAVKQPMSKRRFELVTFAAARELGNTYCSLAHGRALAELLGEQILLSIADGKGTATLSAADRSMMAFAAKVASDATSICREDVDELKDHGFGDEEIFDIAAAAAARVFFTRLLDALGVAADKSFEDMDDRVKQNLVASRPIDGAAVDLLPATGT